MLFFGRNQHLKYLMKPYTSELSSFAAAPGAPLLTNDRIQLHPEQHLREMGGLTIAATETATIHKSFVGNGKHLYRTKPSFWIKRLGSWSRPMHGGEVISLRTNTTMSPGLLLQAVTGTEKKVTANESSEIFIGAGMLFSPAQAGIIMRDSFYHNILNMVGKGNGLPIYLSNGNIRMLIIYRHGNVWKCTDSSFGLGRGTDAGFRILFRHPLP